MITDQALYNKMLAIASKHVFLWYGAEYRKKAYLVIPDIKSDLFIQHQFNDVMCQQAYCNGHIVDIEDQLSIELDNLMSRINPCQEAINKILEKHNVNYRCSEVLGQGLIKLDNGNFILTEGND